MVATKFALRKRISANIMNLVFARFAMQCALEMVATRLALLEQLSANIMNLVFARFAMQCASEMVRLALLFNMPWK